ncbi:SDR family oxidoreductase [Desulfuromonas sp. KJ2020]|uniref:SDR family oxidoreductase n=1 Tax=Desulfuromonas sp. KJ2020 TaxID=2919173 RepID=UPI0020A77162|nr:SDR family oxidoreductase [Desulfuromonas sp. KJ2020]MCP3177781.1 SDR family oxidoreductase [Desulfuromonas sp. KJ2020]
MSGHKDQRPVLVTGGTGYIGSRLVPRLLKAGHRVRVLARSAQKIGQRAWGHHPNLEVEEGDVLNPADLKRALSGCRAVYYLVHSMNPKVKSFGSADRLAAENMVEASRLAGVQQIIYLGGLGEESADLSQHLVSRHEVAAILQRGDVPVTVLRAAMVIGSGSASFEILRYLVDRLPVMVTPRWIDTPCQPIAVRNVLTYLMGVLDNPLALDKTFDIGQPEVVTYRRLMEIYAEEAGLRKRLILPVPVLTPRLSSYWIHLVTPVPAALARPLAEGLRNPVICRNDDIRTLVPQTLLDCREAIRLALERVKQQAVESSWREAGDMLPAEWSDPGDPQWAGGTYYEDCWRVVVEGNPDNLWPFIRRIGGSTGWYYADWLWGVRGIVDRLIGGVGLSRGRRNDEDILPGDVIDFWRVQRVDPPRSLLLVAEMKLPGEAVLEFSLKSFGDGKTELRQTARFLPRGMGGIIYWYLVYPFHVPVFKGMLRGMVERSGASLLEGPARP